MDTQDKVLENRYRRWAKRLGLYIKKDRAKRWSLDHKGGYMILEAYHNLLLAGDRFDLTLEDVGEFLEEYERRLSS